MSYRCQVCQRRWYSRTCPMPRLKPIRYEPLCRFKMKLSIISPTYNESENVSPLIAALEQALGGIDYEIVISDDDSPDLTWARVEQIGRRNGRVRALRRTSNRGVGPSVVDGFSLARGEAVACIDADLQHDPSILPKMLEELERGADL